MTQSDWHPPGQALIAVAFLDGLTGSELVAIELAEALTTAGWTVTILAATYDAKFAARQVDPGIRITSDLDDLDLAIFDLVYVQQLMDGRVIPALAAAAPRLARWPFIVCMHLSILAQIETPGPFAEELLADETWCNSQGTRSSLIERLGPWMSRARLFPNPAPESFARVAPIAGHPRTPRRLLVVSNHLPDEMIAACALLEGRGMTVTRRGQQFQPARITPDMISGHDAVVTIGKTTQYALRARRPVFCYDHFGGPGWLSAANFDDAAAHNFSGRSDPRTRDAETIAAQIETGFAAALAFAEALPDARIAPYRLEGAVAALSGRIAGAQADPSARLNRVRARLEDPVLRGRLQHEVELANFRIDHFLAHRLLIRQRAALRARVSDLQHEIARLQAAAPTQEAPS